MARLSAGKLECVSQVRHRARSIAQGVCASNADPPLCAESAFDQLVSCAALSATGWDEVVTDQTQALELKLIGTDPGTYPVSSRPATGEADVNYTLTGAPGGGALPPITRTATATVRVAENQAINNH